MIKESVEPAAEDGKETDVHNQTEIRYNIQADH